MKWFRKLVDRYNAWMNKMEYDLMKDVLTIQLHVALKERGILVVEDEQPL